MDTYDVALWRSFPLFHGFPYVGEVQADSPLLAVLTLMSTHNLKYVAYAAARVPSQAKITRFQHGVRLCAEGEGPTCNL